MSKNKFLSVTNTQKIFLEKCKDTYDSYYSKNTTWNEFISSHIKLLLANKKNSSIPIYIFNKRGNKTTNITLSKEIYSLINNLKSFNENYGDFVVSIFYYYYEEFGYKIFDNIKSTNRLYFVTKDS